MRARFLTSVLRWLAVALVLRVLVTILANYPDYFPPDFDSLFLQGREATFAGLYRVAFYVHIAVSPVVLLNGLFLLNQVSHWRRGLHRMRGRVQAIAVLGVVLPSAAVMARHAFGGWAAGVSFFALCGATAEARSSPPSAAVSPPRFRPASPVDDSVVPPHLLGCDAPVDLGSRRANRGVQPGSRLYRRGVE